MFGVSNCLVLKVPGNFFLSLVTINAVNFFSILTTRISKIL